MYELNENIPLNTNLILFIVERQVELNEQHQPHGGGNSVTQ